MEINGGSGGDELMALLSVHHSPRAFIARYHPPHLASSRLQPSPASFRISGKLREIAIEFLAADRKISVGMWSFQTNFVEEIRADCVRCSRA